MSLKNIKKISIIGVGFMGGSFAKAFKKRYPSVFICGYTRSKKSYNKLKKLSFLDRIERDCKKVVKDADLVVLASPVYAIADTFQKISPYLKKGSIVIDLGSTKKLIEKTASKYLPKGIDFVGCHPLCGGEKRGAEFSKDNLYQGSICLITSSFSKKTAQVVKKIWENLGCKVNYISSDNHDKLLSCISHIPHAISFVLTDSVPDDFLRFSSASLKDLTRISNSPALVWSDIFLSNKKNISYGLKKFINSLKKLDNIIQAGDKEKIVKFINKVNARQKRII